MAKNIFKGFKQVTRKQFLEAKESNMLTGYLWLVRTEVSDAGANDVANDEYDLYFGSKQYSHFCEGEIPALKDALDLIREDLGFAAGTFEFGEAKTVKDAFAVVASLFEDVTKALEEQEAKISENAQAIAAVETELAGHLVKSVEENDKIISLDGGKLKSALTLAYVPASEGEKAKLALYGIGGVEVSSIDASAFVKDGMLESVKLDGPVAGETGEKYLVLTFNTASGKEEIRMDVSELIDTYSAGDGLELSGNTFKVKVDETVNKYLQVTANGIAVSQALLDEVARLDGEVRDYVDKNFVKLEGFNEFSAEMESKLDGIEDNAQVNKIEAIKVNGVDATVVDKVAEVTVEADDITLGTAIKNGEEVKYDASTNLSVVLQGIQDSIRGAIAGGVNSVVAGDKALKVNTADANNPVITLNVETPTVETIADGHLEIVKGNNGIFAVMYYDGDDVEESEPIDYKEAIEKGGNVVLNDNVQLEDAFVLSNVNTTVNLNNKTVEGGLFTESNGGMVEGNTDSYAFWVKEGAELTIDGEGEVIAQPAEYSMSVWANGGTVTINGGKFYNGGDGCDLIYASNGGKVYIYGGEFHATERIGNEPATKNKYSALNIKDKDRDICEIVVYGGKFYGFDPANNLSEGPGTNFVADGYKSVEVETGVWEVMPE